MCRLFEIYKETPVAGESPRILLLMPARHYREEAVAGKGVHTDTPGIFSESPIKDNENLV